MASTGSVQNIKYFTIIKNHLTVPSDFLCHELREVLHCQPGDILEYTPEAEEENA